MRIRLPRCRPISTKLLAILLVFLGFLACCYYYTTPNPKSVPNALVILEEKPVPHHVLKKSRPLPDQCPIVMETSADVDTVSVHRLFEFQPSWLRTKEFWDKSFEDRYDQMKTEVRPSLKVIVVPHSHNDPGWLKTFEQYFEWRTKKIINNMVQKLNQYRNMTFIWTEISFLNAWWERSHPVKRKALKKLVQEGRLEITAGGWVMPDEACTHIYALIDQFIEGHHWVKTNLGVTPKTGWSIDPFGHGPTVPYILDKSGLEGTIIQRIHYAWKQWLAQRQVEEFYWIPGWKTQKPSMIVHNQPFDIYSIKSSCGPHPAVCLSFDFRRIPGEYSEYTDKFEEITDQNVERKSKTLIEEYDRIGSLTEHNVVLVPLGDDFRYEYPSEFDSQYTNYMKMFNYINNHNDVFNAEVSFGTPADYFNAVKERLKVIPTLKGDFFVYSDIFTEGKPAYWSGYFTTRPYLKLLARQFEHQLRTSEILFTLVYNHVKQNKSSRLEGTERALEKYYEQLIGARRNLGLFQHHDAITGTSRANVMSDYGLKLFNHIYYCIRLQEVALTAVMIPDEKVHLKNALQSEVVWDTYGKPAKKIQVSFFDKKKVVLFNPLAEFRTEVITLRSNISNIRVFDTRQEVYVPYQITPNIELRANGKRVISDLNFDLVFVASMPPLSSVTFNLEEHINSSKNCVIFCNNCSNIEQEGQKLFSIQRMLPGDIQLENAYMMLVINRNTGFLRQVYRKDLRKRNAVEIQFGAYQSAQRHSGAYLFMPDYESPEKPVLDPYTSSNGMQDDNIIIVSGPVFTEITVMYLPFLVHTLRIFNVDDPYLIRGILVENVVDFESPPKNRDTELFMRIQTDLQNGEPPQFYTDQNGFQYQKRVKVEKVGIAGNYYPITTMAWIQDEETRLSLVTNHAQGAAAFEPGRLEVMLDRRTLYDDFRGIGEGVLDNKPMVFQNWLTVEAMPNAPRYKRDVSFDRVHQNAPNADTSSNTDRVYELPTQTVEFLSRTLNYPVNVYLIDTSEVGEIEVKSHETFLHEFPDGIHMLTLRSIPDATLDQFPSNSAYMVLHRPGYSCSVGAENANSKTYTFTHKTRFNKLKIANLTSVSLTGLKSYATMRGFSDISLEPLEVATYQIGF